MKIFSNAKWIWLKKSGVNEYVDFVDYFNYEDNGESVYVNISVDTNYMLYVNGNFIDCGQYCDYPNLKFYEKLDITKFVKVGKNKIAIVAYYVGKGTSINVVGKAGLIFAVTRGEEILLSSSEKTLSRRSREYQSGEMDNITLQLGFTFIADLKNADNFKELDFDDIEGGFAESFPVRKSTAMQIRPIKKLVINSSKEVEIVAQGTYLPYDRLPITMGEYMQKAYLSSRAFYEMTGIRRAPESVLINENQSITFKTDYNKIYVLADLKEESVGYLDLDIEIEEDADIYVGYGEHLADLRPRTAPVSSRSFTLLLKAKKGRNKFFGGLRKLGLRYLMLFVENGNSVKINKLTIKPIEYPVTEVELKLSDKLHQKIYEVSVNTLKKCMLDHYVDCPWREQALYGMDSCNQMLFGFYTFKEFDYPRASLKLFTELGEDGLLQLTAPGEAPLKIPCYSLYWIYSIRDYAKASGDKKFLKEMLPTAEKIMGNFVSRVDENDMIKSFAGEEYWNFFEWMGELAGRPLAENGQPVYVDYSKITEYATMTNAFFIRACSAMREIYEMLKINEDKALFYRDLSDRVFKANQKTFYSAEEGIYYAYKRDGELLGKYELVNAMMLYIGRDDDEIKKKLEQKLITGEGLTPLTLTNTLIKYEALYYFNKDNLEYILTDIEKSFAKMLYNGATTFWETELGEMDFDDAGSLCHAWAAVPAYVYFRFILGCTVENKRFKFDKDKNSRVKVLKCGLMNK